MKLHNVDVLLDLALIAYQARFHAKLLLETVNVLCVAPQELATFRKHLDKMVRWCWLGLQCLGMEFRDEGVKDRCGFAVAKQVGIEKILALQNRVGILLLDQIVQSIG